MDHIAASQHASLNFETISSLKQKRKRTSPRDHAVLESAYQKNSKPGKDERAELVQQVDLSEKEVQIWFQNRRQNDRRKSKPLLPHELIPHFRNGVPSEVSRQLISPTASQERPRDGQVEEKDVSPSQVLRPLSRASSIQNLLNPTSDTEPILPKAHQPTANTIQLSTPPSSFEDTSPAQPVPDSTVSTSESAKAHVSAPVTKKRSHEEMSGQPSTSNGPATFSGDGSKDSILKRSSSFVRLAVNADGLFKVRTSDELTPSPPKKRAAPSELTSRRSGDLVRSRSAVGPDFDFKDINPPIRPVPGRSRDARTWEFYCDKQARDSLVAQAEEQENGSAISAINLMRVGNQNKPQALSPNPSKHNLRRAGGGGGSKPALSRSRSSVARMQSTARPNETDLNKPKPHARKNSGSDSDKENWMPGTRDSHNIMRRMHPSVSRSTILQEQVISGPRNPENPETEDSSNKSRLACDKAKVDDLDCIQGLLSLSQGAWR